MPDVGDLIIAYGSLAIGIALGYISAKGMFDLWT